MAEFSDKVGDNLLVQEMYFVESIRTVIVPCANIFAYLDAHTAADAREISTATAQLVKDVRSSWAIFSAKVKRLGDHLRGPDGTALGNLFKHTEDRMVEPLHGLVDPNVIVEDLEEVVTHSCSMFGNIWSEHLKLTTDQLNSWCPVWTHARDHLLDKQYTPVVLSLCKNEHYGKLAAASTYLFDMIARIRALHNDDMKKLLVDGTRMTEAKKAATNGTETTVATPKQTKKTHLNKRSSPTRCLRSRWRFRSRRALRSRRR